jgi:hypothetical protein
VGFELTIPAFERPKTVHALDGAAAVIGTRLASTLMKIKIPLKWPHFVSHKVILSNVKILKGLPENRF